MKGWNSEVVNFTVIAIFRGGLSCWLFFPVSSRIFGIELNGFLLLESFGREKNCHSRLRTLLINIQVFMCFNKFHLSVFIDYYNGANSLVHLVYISSLESNIHPTCNGTGIPPVIFRGVLFDSSLPACDILVVEIEKDVGVGNDFVTCTDQYLLVLPDDVR